MNLDLDSTQALLRDTLREYLEAEVPFDRIRQLDRDRRWDEGLWKALCDQGWLALPFDEARGGGGGSLVDVGILLEEFTRRAAVVPLLEALVAGIAIERAAPSERAAELIPALLDGSFLPVPAILETQDDYGAVGLTLDAEGRLTGEKLFVDYGSFASHHLVAARAGEETSLCLVDARGPEVECEALESIGRTPTVRVSYRVAPAERIAGGVAFEELLLRARALAAVQCVGCAQQALDMTVQYASVREAFGRPIGSFQAVKHHAANMASRVAAARHLAFEALFDLDSGRATPAQVAYAKASASRAVPEVTMLAHQIHGGNGVIEENDLYFFTLRGKERSLAWGSVDECLAVAAASVDTLQDWLR